MAIVTKISRSRRVCGAKTASLKAVAHRGARRRVAVLLGQACLNEDCAVAVSNVDRVLTDRHVS